MNYLIWEIKRAEAYLPLIFVSNLESENGIDSQSGEEFIVLRKNLGTESCSGNLQKILTHLRAENIHNLKTIDQKSQLF